MDFNMRDWIIVVGILLIVFVFLDGYRRIRNERRNKIRVALNKQFLNSNQKPLYSELPNGGARVRSRNDHDTVDEPLDSAHNLACEPALDNHQSLDTSLLTEPSLDEQKQVLAMEEPLLVDDDRVEYTQNADAEGTHDINNHWVETDSSPVDPVFKADINNSHNRQGSPNSRRSLPHAVVSDVLAIHVVARDDTVFKGPELLNILLACHLRFGDMGIFHLKNKASMVLFSVANIVEPGTFDLDNINYFSTPGISLFMSLPGPDQLIETFHTMLTTAQAIAQYMDGKVLDDTHNSMTPQTLEYYRQRLRDYLMRVKSQPFVG